MCYNKDTNKGRRYRYAKKPTYREVDVTLEYLEETGSSTKIEAYINEGERWNVYLVPIFKQDILLEVLSLIKEAYEGNEVEGPAALHSEYATEHINEAYTTTSFVCHKGQPWANFHRVDIDGDKRYFKMESGFTWTEVE